MPKKTGTLTAALTTRPATRWTLCLGLIGGLAGASCVPPERDVSNGGQGGSSSTGGRGGSSGGATGGSGGATGGSGGATGGSGGATGGSGGSTGGSGSNTGGATGGSGGATGGSGGATGGSGGSGGSAGSGGSGGATGGSGGSGGATDGGGNPDGGGAEAAAGPMTFAKIHDQILAPTCSAPGNRCHSIVQDNNFIFAEGMAMRSYMLLVPNAPNVGTIPARVNTLLSYVTPTTAGNPATVRMPPQSGANLGNPPIRRAPLTADQVAIIRTWAMSGAKFQ